MTQYLFRKLLSMVFVLWGVSVMVFSTIHLLPGDAVDYLTSEVANPEFVQRLRNELGLDRPVVVQYGVWLSKALRGDLGRSLTDRRPVAAQVVSRLKNTAQLAVFGLLVAGSLGILAGVISAARPYTAFDYASMFFALVGVSIPSFFLGLLLMLVFAVDLRLLPAAGTGTPLHLVLPSLTLGLVSAGLVARLTRSAMLDVVKQDFVRTARAKGVRDVAVLMRHAFRNSLLPIVTILGLQVGYMLGGSVIVESVFAWPGMGSLVVEAAIRRDYPTVQGALLVYAFLIALVNLLVDTLYVVLDPRVRYG